MKQKAKFLFLLGIVNCQLSMVNSQEHVVPFSFGDMDHWVVREIHESGIIGGNTKHLYELGPTDTIIGNTAYTNRGGSPWANSNVMAKVAGVVRRIHLSSLKDGMTVGVHVWRRAWKV